MTSISNWIAAVIVAALVTGCGEPVAVASFPTVPPGLPPEIYDAIVADLTDQLSGSPVLITVTAESVNWNDASLGCPQPGEFYAQVITPGFRVIFTVDGTEYDYRVSEAGDFRLCS